MNHAWNVYKKELFTRMPSLREIIHSGASEAAVRAAEEKIGVAFPAELREMYLANDGDDGDAICGVLLGFHFLPLDELTADWESWAALAGDEALNNSAHFTSRPEGRIKRRYANTKWIPLCSDSSGNFIGIDLDPDVKGRPGQVINFGRDEHDKVVLEVSLNAFLERLTRVIRSEHFFVGEYDGEEVIFFGPNGEEDGAHLTDYLKSEDSVK